MKKLIAFVLLMALCLSVSACSQEGSNQSVTEPSSTQQNTQTKYVAPATSQSTKPSDSTSGGKLYRVQVGAFTVKANAEALLKKLKAAGFADAYIREG